MLHLKNVNELIYINFDKKDYYGLKKLCTSNVNKISIICHELEQGMFEWLIRVVQNKHYDHLKIVLYTASNDEKSNVIYKKFIRTVLCFLPTLKKRVKLVGGIYTVVCKNRYYNYCKSAYDLEVTSEPMGFCGYTHDYITEHYYADMFYKHGLAIYGPSIMYKDREAKYNILCKLTEDICKVAVDADDKTVKIIYDAYISYITIYTGISDIGTIDTISFNKGPVECSNTATIEEYDITIQNIIGRDDL